MKYIEMSVDEACEYLRNSNCKTVLVAVSDTEENSTPFVKKTKAECECIIRDGKSVTRIHDDFINQLRVFTDLQRDLHPTRGVISTLLLRV